MKLSKKAGHCLFVEEETYDWVPAKSGPSKRVLFVVAMFMLTIVVVLTQLR